MQCSLFEPIYSFTGLCVLELWNCTCFRELEEHRFVTMPSPPMNMFNHYFIKKSHVNVFFWNKVVPLIDDKPYLLVRLSWANSNQVKINAGWGGGGQRGGNGWETCMGWSLMRSWASFLMRFVDPTSWVRFLCHYILSAGISLQWPFMMRVICLQIFQWEQLAYIYGKHQLSTQISWTSYKVLI